MCPSALGAIFFKTIVACLATRLLSTRTAFAVPIQQTQGILVTDDDAHEGLRAHISGGSRIGLNLPARNNNFPANLSFLSDVPRSTAEYRLLNTGQKLDNYGLYPEEEARTAPHVSFELSNYRPMAALGYGQLTTRSEDDSIVNALGQQIFELLNAEVVTLDKAGKEIEGELRSLGSTVEGSVEEASHVIPKTAQAKQLLHDFGDKIVKGLTVLAQKITRTARIVSRRLRRAIGAAEKKVDPSGAIRAGLTGAKAKLSQFKRRAAQKFRNMPRSLRALKSKLFRRKGPNSEASASTAFTGSEYDTTRF